MVTKYPVSTRRITLALAGKALPGSGRVQLRDITQYLIIHNWLMVRARSIDPDWPAMLGGFGAGADRWFSVCISRNLDLASLKVQVPSGSQTATGGSLRQPAG